MTDLTEKLQEQVRQALAEAQPLAIRGGGSRRLPRVLADRAAPFLLDLGAHAGVVDYLPDELVLTARAGTPLQELDALLAEQGQVLPFEPPRSGPNSTLGGAVATGLAGPARPWWGSCRDAVLGIRLLDGRAETGRYGGQVMKNVAGYDVARLNAGAWGALGALLEVSLRLRPAPAVTRTLVQELPAAAAVDFMVELGRDALPVTGLVWSDGCLRARLAGSEQGVQAAAARIGGVAPTDPPAAFWNELRDQRLDFFATAAPLYRLSVPAAAPLPDWPAQWLLDWGGAQRWCATSVPVERVLDHARRVGGWAMHWQPEPSWPALSPALAALHRRIKQAFDPDAVLPPLIWEAAS